MYSIFLLNSHNRDAEMVTLLIVAHQKAAKAAIVHDAFRLATLHVPMVPAAQTQTHPSSAPLTGPIDS